MPATEGVSVYEPPHIKFPFENYKVVEYMGCPVVPYVSKEQVEAIISLELEMVDINKYPYMVINKNGAIFHRDEIIKRKRYNGQIIEVEYHRARGGFGVEVATAIPRQAYGKGVLIVDDLWDSGYTGQAMLDDAGPNSLAVMLFWKVGVENQLTPDLKRVLFGAKIDNIWIAGCGANLDMRNDPIYPKNYGREIYGLVARPDSLK